MPRISFVSERLLRKAFEWVDQVAHELKWDDAYLAKRRFDIESEVRTRGMYTHTEEEIVHGARVSWRNSAKCVGRIAWNTLMVRDRRHVTNLDHMFAECLEHQRLATADGSLKAVSEWILCECLYEQGNHVTFHYISCLHSTFLTSTPRVHLLVSPQ